MPPQQGSFLRPTHASTQGDPPRRSRLVTAPTSLRFHEAQVNAMTEIHEEYPLQFRTFSEVTRAVIDEGIPALREKLRMEGDRLALLKATTDVDRSRIHRELVEETISKLLVEVTAALAIGTPNILTYVQRLIDRQRTQIERLPAGDPWRAEGLRRLTSDVQPLVTGPTPRHLHFVHGRYSDEDEAAQLED
jgi:hypothetical protein